MLLRVPFDDYGYDCAQRCSHAPGRRHGGRRLRSLVLAGGRLREEAREPDLPPHFGAPSAKSYSSIRGLARLRWMNDSRVLAGNRLVHSRWLLLPPLPSIELCPLAGFGMAPDVKKLG